jgi:glucosamine-6-phosphate deaminase
LNIVIERDYDAVSRYAAAAIAAEIRGREQVVLGLATGSTPLGMYREWVEMVRRGELSFSGVTTFNLDEYVGLPPDHPQSYRTYMEQHLFRHLDLSPGATHIPRGDAPDMELHAREYDEQIRAAGGIDIQVLGIGRNGHIGFNEPGERFGATTHIVRLAETTRQANARFFPRPEDVPTHAVTMGLKSIMNAREIFLLASGEDKSEAVARAILGDVTPDCPASVLQLHPRCVFVLDQAAASRLPSDLWQGRREIVI